MHWVQKQRKDLFFDLKMEVGGAVYEVRGHVKKLNRTTKGQAGNCMRLTYLEVEVMV